MSVHDQFFGDITGLRNSGVRLITTLKTAVFMSVHDQFLGILPD